MRRHFMHWLAVVVLSIPGAAMATFSNMYVFGDSLSDNGNLYNWTGAPNPVTGGVSIPLSSPYFPGRFEDGKSYSELLWSGLQSSGNLQATGDLTPRGLKPGFPPGLDTNPPAGTNYAVGGARSRYHTFDVGGGLPPVGLSPGSATFYPFSLRGQFDQFSVDSGGSADRNALFVVWSGSNDVGDALRLGAINPIDAGRRIQETLADIGLVLGGLVASGAQNLLVPNLPDLGLVPEVNQNPLAVAAATDLSARYNAALDTILASLFNMSPDINLYTFDTFDLLGQVTKSAAAFGFTDVTNPCLKGLFVGPPATGPVSVCNNPDEFLFWDTLHPTARTHEILAQGMLAALPEPASLLLVGVGLVAIRLATRRNRRGDPT